MWTNTLKRKLSEGRTVYGPFLRMPGPNSAELAAAAGFDFVIIDMEHGPLDLPATEAMIVAARAAGITPLVRVPEASRVAIHRVLDAGAHGVVVPQVSSAADARLVSEATRFYPVGARGMAGPVRGNAWGAMSAEAVNLAVLTLAQIESQGGLEHLDAIAAQPGIDLLFVGPMDLSQALGLPGQVEHPRVVAAIESVIEGARRHGKQVAIYAGTPEAAAYWRARGVRLMGTGLDTVLLKQSFTALRESLTATQPAG